MDGDDVRMVVAIAAIIALFCDLNLETPITWPVSVKFAAVIVVIGFLALSGPLGLK